MMTDWLFITITRLMHNHQLKDKDKDWSLDYDLISSQRSDGRSSRTQIRKRQWRLGSKAHSSVCFWDTALISEKHANNALAIRKQEVSQSLLIIQAKILEQQYDSFKRRIPTPRLHLLLLFSPHDLFSSLFRNQHTDTY